MWTPAKTNTAEFYKDVCHHNQGDAKLFEHLLKKTKQNYAKNQRKAFTLLQLNWFESMNPVSTISVAYWPAGGSILLFCQCNKVTHRPVMPPESCFKFASTTDCFIIPPLISFPALEWSVHSFLPPPPLWVAFANTVRLSVLHSLTLRV